MLCNTDVSFLAFDLSGKKNDVIIVKKLRVSFMFIQDDNLKVVTRLSEPQVFVSVRVLRFLLNMDI